MIYSKVSENFYGQVLEEVKSNHPKAYYVGYLCSSFVEFDDDAGYWLYNDSHFKGIFDRNRGEIPLSEDEFQSLAKASKQGALRNLHAQSRNIERFSYNDEWGEDDEDAEENYEDDYDEFDIYRDEEEVRSHFAEGRLKMLEEVYGVRFTMPYCPHNSVRTRPFIMKYLNGNYDFAVILNRVTAKRVKK